MFENKYDGKKLCHILYFSNKFFVADSQKPNETLSKAINIHGAELTKISNEFNKKQYGENIWSIPKKIYYMYIEVERSFALLATKNYAIRKTKKNFQKIDNNLATRHKFSQILQPELGNKKNENLKSVPKKL